MRVILVVRPSVLVSCNRGYAVRANVSRIGRRLVVLKRLVVRHIVALELLCSRHRTGPATGRSLGIDLAQIEAALKEAPRYFGLGQHVADVAASHVYQRV